MTLTKVTIILLFKWKTAFLQNPLLNIIEHNIDMTLIHVIETLYVKYLYNISFKH